MMNRHSPEVPFSISPRYPDPRVEVLHPSFAKYRVYSASIEQLNAAASMGASRWQTFRTVTLPLFPLMRDEDVDRVCAAVTRVLRPVLT